MEAARTICDDRRMTLRTLNANGCKRTIVEHLSLCINENTRSPSTSRDDRLVEFLINKHRLKVYEEMHRQEQKSLCKYANHEMVDRALVASALVHMRFV